VRDCSQYVLCPGHNSRVTPRLGRFPGTTGRPGPARPGSVAALAHPACPAGLSHARPGPVARPGSEAVGMPYCCPDDPGSGPEWCWALSELQASDPDLSQRSVTPPGSLFLAPRAPANPATWGLRPVAADADAWCCHSPFRWHTGPICLLLRHARLTRSARLRRAVRQALEDELLEMAAAAAAGSGDAW
jgi:hypothetical protein